MTSRLPLLLSLGMGLTGFAQQPLGEAYWQGIRDKADSVLVAEFGKEFREKHIFDPAYPINYAVVRGNGVDWDDRDTVTVAPEWCFFEYSIGLDEAWAADHMGMIQFTITPEGGRVPASMEPRAEWIGFVDRPGHDPMPPELESFIRIAKDNGVRASRKDGPWSIEWIPPDSLAKAAGEERGRYELRLAQYLHRKGVTPTAGGGASYWKAYRFAVFDLFSGALLRTEEEQVGYMIACGAANL